MDRGDREKEIRIDRPRVRRTWKIKPVTRVEGARRAYRREREKEDLRDLAGEEERVLGVDLGEKRVGLAITDPSGTIASPLETVDRDAVFSRLRELVRAQNVGEIVVGLPLNMDGSRGDKAEEAERFAADLEEELQIRVVLWDERLSSVSAEKAIMEAGEKPSRTKPSVDMVSAALILEGYLKSRQ